MVRIEQKRLAVEADSKSGAPRGQAERHVEWGERELVVPTSDWRRTTCTDAARVLDFLLAPKLYAWKTRKVQPSCIKTGMFSINGIIIILTDEGTSWVHILHQAWLPPEDTRTKAISLQGVAWESNHISTTEKTRPTGAVFDQLPYQSYGVLGCWLHTQQ